MTTVGGQNVSGKTVVVGVDGSANARAALGFAIDEAVMRRFLASGGRRGAVAGLRLRLVTMLALASPEELVDDIREATQSRVDEHVAAMATALTACPLLWRGSRSPRARLVQRADGA